MSVLYCHIPDFAAALARQRDPGLAQRPLILIGPDQRVLGASAEATMCGIAIGQSTRAAEICCPDARLVEADMDRYQATFESLLQVLEMHSPDVEPHGWGSAYVDLGDLTRRRDNATTFCSEIGRRIRKELGPELQPALGLNSTKFTAYAATQGRQPGRLLAITATCERTFLRPLPVTWLPLERDTLLRLTFLGLRTLGQYAALPSAAVWQQFGQAGKLAQRCARGEDNRPVIPRTQERRLVGSCDLESPLEQEGPLLQTCRHVLLPLLQELQGTLQACSLLRLGLQLADDSRQEREQRLLFPSAAQEKILLLFRQMLIQMRWTAGVTAMQLSLERIQDAAPEQLSLFPTESEKERKLQQMQSYIAARFGADRLRRAVLAQPAAPLSEWRSTWNSELP